jgi:hypothetical protein
MRRRATPNLVVNADAPRASLRARGGPLGLDVGHRMLHIML